MGEIEVDVKNIPDDVESVKDVEITVSDCQCCNWKKLRGKSCPVCGTNHTMKVYEDTWVCHHCGYSFSNSDEEVDIDGLDGRTEAIYEFLQEALEDKEA